MPLIKSTPTPPPSPEPARPPRLDDDAPAARRRAAQALAGQPDAAPALCARLAHETDASVREAILTALVRIGTADAAAGLFPYLASEDAALRNAVIETVQQMPPDTVAPHVEAFLDDPDSDVRIFTVQLAARLAHASRMDWLARAVERDPHVNVCLAALEGLVETGRPDVLPILERLRDRFPDDPVVAFSVDAAHRRFQAGA
ncbi:HEAT repeat domain-containing protein [Azospirillum sp.]|uniref:HEAT repeat domain-containing protein n=1 Tax=Azospirillum sp. TaxID=34012 RepID=UPI002D6ADC37|nr:HEAT repeat domain-containing protein [Azospirillum sp.]HYD67657.1 HEAT repeat domain-containing protein [Azospirillum sp.]